MTHTVVSSPTYHLFQIPTPQPHRREVSQKILRAQLPTLLAPLLFTDSATLRLASPPGHTPQLAPPWGALQLSFSHAPGLSLLALCEETPIGVDLLTQDSALPTTEWQQLAKHYLSPITQKHLLALQPQEASSAFVLAWTKLEAGLKCLDIGLQEWHPALEKRFASLHIRPLALPDGWVGSVATAASPSCRQAA